MIVALVLIQFFCFAEAVDSQNVSSCNGAFDVYFVLDL